MIYLRAIAAILTIGSLAACSGGCNCNVPPIAGPTVAPGVVPSPKPSASAPLPGTSASPVVHVSPSPVASVVPAPSPSPTAVVVVPPLGCSQGAGAVPLGPALAPFAILAAASVTNVGATNVGFATGATTVGVDDDLIGVSSAPYSITGFYLPGTDTDGPNALYGVNAGGLPAFNANTPVTLAAQNALTVAYTAVAGVASTATVAGDLSQASVPGHPTGTLPPGVYTSTSSLNITNGNLTLDGGGNAQSVFIFQMASTLTTVLNGNVGGNVILTNGANACNIYWQVGSSATLGGATFSGNVLAYASVTINAPTFTGRALARTGTVTIPVVTGSIITNPGGN